VLIYGAILGCRKAALAMAAGMSLGRSPFLRIESLRERRKSDEPEPIEVMKARLVIQERNNMFKMVGFSDHALLAAVYERWDASGRGGGARKQVCDSLGLSVPGMRDMEQLVKQLGISLTDAGYAESYESNRNSESWRIVRTCAVSSMSPGQLVKVVRPKITYYETAEGAKEKDGQAREFKFYVRTDREEKQCEKSGNNACSLESEERVFVHPSSANFVTGSYSCPWLVYHSLVRTSKSFLRDITECTAYALLLFGGPLSVQASNDLILVDGWVTLAANARIGSLVGGLRRKIDDLLATKISEPSFEVADSREMRLIVKLLKTDGLG
jgi:ATP-dependent RNA helicase DHX57